MGAHEFEWNAQGNRALDRVDDWLDFHGPALPVTCIEDTCLPALGRRGPRVVVDVGDPFIGLRVTLGIAANKPDRRAESIVAVDLGRRLLDRGDIDNVQDQGKGVVVKVGSNARDVYRLAGKTGWRQAW